VNTTDSYMFTEEALDRCHDSIRANESQIISLSNMTAFFLGGLAVYLVKR
jgi:hypothetical protein